MNKTPVHVRVSRQFEFPAERVFNAWLIPSEASKFLFATPTGHVVKIEIDPRVGGKFTIVDKRDGQDVEHVGQYVEISRPKRLSFTFSVPKFSAEATRASIELNSLAKGCELILTHEGVRDEFAARTRDAWTKMLEALDASLRA